MNDLSADEKRQKLEALYLVAQDILGNCYKYNLKFKSDTNKFGETCYKVFDVELPAPLNDKDTIKS